jgi:hypothetical protein
MRVRKERTCKVPKRGKVQREEEARSPPNEWALEVAGATEETVCESVWITRIQTTPKSFRVDTNEVVTVQAVDRWKNCAAQDSSESSPFDSSEFRMREADARPEGAHAKCGVLLPHTGEVCGDGLEHAGLGVQP